jgi:hypothetical protein
VRIDAVAVSLPEGGRTPTWRPKAGAGGRFRTVLCAHGLLCTRVVRRRDQTPGRRASVQAGAMPPPGGLLACVPSIRVPTR